MHRLILSLIVAALALAAQTTTVYTITPGTSCVTVEGCYYENVTAPGPLYGRFEAGGYWTQFQFEAFEGQNPGYKAQFCNGTAVWTTALLDNGHWFYVMDCNASPDQTSQDQPAQIHVELEAHSYTISFPCGGRVRYICHQARWAIDEGSVAITQ